MIKDEDDGRRLKRNIFKAMLFFYSRGKDTVPLYI